MKGAIYRMHFEGTGHVQRGSRYAVELQNEDMWSLTTVLVAPTTGSDGPAPAKYRPDVEIEGEPGRILVEQLRVVEFDRLGQHVGYLDFEQQQAVDDALRYVLDLR